MNELKGNDVCVDHVSGVQLQIDRFGSMAARLELAVKTLEDRLSPLLMSEIASIPSVAMTEGDCPEPDPGSELRCWLSSRCDRLDSVCDSLVALENRVDL